MKLHLSPMISSARDTELGRPRMNRLPSEARRVFRPGLAGIGRRRGRRDTARPRASSFGPHWEQVTIGMAFATAGACGSASAEAAFPGQPPVAELHQGDEARIEIESHLGQPVLLSLREPGAT